MKYFTMVDLYKYYFSNSLTEALMSVNSPKFKI